jgi:hypothetical protein
VANEPLRIPEKPYKELEGIAERFLVEHHSEGTIPVPVEEIIEFGLRLNIIPMPGLRKHFDIDGFVSRDLREISVDQYIQETLPNYYRYVLAHELAHVLIHNEIVEQFAFESIAEWKKIILGVSRSSAAAGVRIHRG